MNSFEILDHPADIGIKIKGKSLEELFANAAIGTTSLIADPKSIEEKIKKETTLKATNIEELFIKWIDEIIFLFDSEGFLLKDVTVGTLRATSLQAPLTGEKFNKTKHEIKLYLKAVTYHQLEIKQLDDKSWEAKVYFDV